MASNYGPKEVEEIGIVQNGLVFWVHASALSSYSGTGSTWKDIKGSNDLTMDHRTGAVTFDTTYNPIAAKSMNFGGSGASNKVSCPSLPPINCCNIVYTIISNVLIIETSNMICTHCQYILSII